MFETISSEKLIPIITEMISGAEDPLRMSWTFSTVMSIIDEVDERQFFTCDRSTILTDNERQRTIGILERLNKRACELGVEDIFPCALPGDDSCAIFNKLAFIYLNLMNIENPPWES